MGRNRATWHPNRRWDPRVERDACGIGFVADAGGRATRGMVDVALDALCRVRHRGAVAADAKTGDGAGLLLLIPGRFLAGEMDKLGVPGGDPEWLGVAMVFVSDDTPLTEVHRIVENACRAEAIDVVAWREVPTHPGALGDRARESMPRIVQALLLRPPSPNREDAERLSHRARKRAEALVRKEARLGHFP